ncbi:MAG: hypothetical protein ACREUX_20515, partial [Burkholderiales bacterium]
SEPGMTAKRYLLIVAVVTGALAAAVVTLCNQADPYGLHAANRADDPGEVDATEPTGAFWRKAFTVRRIMPRTVILGTSRADAALDSNHPAFSAEDAPVLNLALGAAEIEQMRLLLIHANTVSDLRKAVIGLDIEAFLGGGRADFHAAALEGNPRSEPAWLSRLLVYFSPAALASAVSQLLAPESTLSKPPFETVLKALDGQRGLIWTTEINNFYARLAQLFPPAAKAARWNADPRRRAAMQSFRQLLAYAREHDIELRLFVSPVHARYLEWYRRVGWWPLFQDWKRELVNAIASERPAPAANQIVLWDFSGFHSAATETVPALGDLETRMKWYRESSHYSPALGYQILSCVVAGRSAEGSPLPEARIDGGNIERHLSRLARDAEAWRAAQRGEAENVREMVQYLRRIGRK